LSKKVRNLKFEEMTDTKIKLKERDINKIKEICDFFDNDPGELINALHRCQGEFGYLPAEVQEIVSEYLNVPLAKVYGVVTFYSFFTMKPKGKFPISICTGTACYVRGAEKVLDEFKKELGIAVGETSVDGKFSLSSLRCVGACGLAPVVLVGEKTYGRVAPDDVQEILAEYVEQ
jgi:NADP-reducing hydrogenase subunit HndA